MTTKKDQIANQLRHAIANGFYNPGDTHPTITELMADHGVARDTVRDALTSLNNAGIITTRRGAGSVVRDNSNVELAYKLGATTPAGWKAQTGGKDIVVETGWDEADTDIAYRLSVPVGAPVIRRVRHYYKNDGIAQIAEQWFPKHIRDAVRDSGGGDLADLNDDVNRPDVGPNVYDRITSAGHPVDTKNVEEIFTSRMPHPDEGDTMEMPPGVPVLITDRTTFNLDNGLPVETLHAVGDASRMSAAINLRTRQ